MQPVPSHCALRCSGGLSRARPGPFLLLRELHPHLLAAGGASLSSAHRGGGLASIPRCCAASAFAYAALWLRQRERRQLRRITRAASEEADGESTSSLPPRPPKEEPTPFPVDDLFPPEVTQLLDLLDEDEPDEDDLCDALADLEELHEADRQWVTWPSHVEEVRQDPYKRGLFLLIRGLLRLIDDYGGNVQGSAVDLLKNLALTSFHLTRVPPTFLVECGAVSVLCQAAQDTSDSAVFAVLTEISRMAPRQMISTIVQAGGLAAAVATIEEAGFTPLEQLAALDLITSMAKRAPVQAVEAGAFEAVKGVSNEALVVKRNKIMSLLRPIVEQEEDEQPSTNIRAGGLRF